MFVPADRRQHILQLTLPIIGGMASQNVMNVVDAWMVGSLGSASLGAVNMAGFANFLCAAPILGLAAGVQATASRRVGEGKINEAAMPLNAGLVLAIVFGSLWALALYFATPSLFPSLIEDPAVLVVGVPYLQARLCAMPAWGCNFAFRGYWNAIDRPALYARTMVTMHVANIFLNWLLIFGNLGAPELGATGAGIASAMAVYIGTAQYVYLGFRHARGHGFARMRPTRESYATLLPLALPAGVQQSFFAAGMLTYTWVAGLVSTDALAAQAAIQTLLMIIILPCLGFGFASATLVGQALGRKEVADARRWAWQVTQLSVLVAVALSLPGHAVPDLLLGLFLREPGALEIARIPFTIALSTVWLEGIMLVMMQSFMGAGAVRTSLVVTVCFQWLFGLPLTYLLGPTLGYGLIGMQIGSIAQRGMQASVLSLLWRGDRWTRHRV